MQVKIQHNRKKIQGRAPVQIECYFSRTQRIYFSPGVRVVDNEWDSKQNQVSKKNPRCIVLNARIRQLLDKIYKWEQEQTLKGVALRPDELKKHIKGASGFLTLNEYMEHQLKKGPEFKNLRLGTWKRHNSVLNGLNIFGKIHFKQFDHNTLHKYHEYLLERMQPGTAGSVHRVIRKYVNRAINDGLLFTNPYKNFKIPKEQQRITYLTEDEIQRLREYKGIERIEKVRDLFLFQCLTGMSFSDMQALKPSDITYGSDMPYIEKPRIKTDVKPQLIPLFDEAMAIIEKYADQHFCFPKITNQKFNAFLKELAIIKGIQKNLTSHVARHSFATILVSKGMPLESVSAILGHASLRTTSVYAKIVIGKIQADFKRLGIDKL